MAERRHALGNAEDKSEIPTDLEVVILDNNSLSIHSYLEEQERKAEAKKRVTKKLDVPLTVAVKIYEVTEVKKEPIWFTKLCEKLPNIKEHAILMAINTLSDWGIIKGQYGETKKGHAGRLYFVSSENMKMIRELYEEVSGEGENKP